MNIQTAVYVIALEQCASLLAQAHKEATKSYQTGFLQPFRRRHQDQACEFTAQADRISLNYFGRKASDLL